MNVKNSLNGNISCMSETADTQVLTNDINNFLLLSVFRLKIVPVTLLRSAFVYFYINRHLAIQIYSTEGFL